LAQVGSIAFGLCSDLHCNAAFSMKLVSRALQTTLVLSQCLSRTCVALDLPGGNEAFLSPIGNRPQPSDSALDSEGPLDAVGAPDASDLEVAPLKDLGGSEELRDPGAGSVSELQPARQQEGQEPLHEASERSDSEPQPLRGEELQEKLHDAEPQLPPRDVEGQDELRETGGPRDSEVQRPPPEAPQAPASLAAVQQKTSGQGQQGNTRKEINVRPSAKEKKPDVVTFALFAKQFYDTDLKKNTFSLDNVMTIKWKDDRVKDLVPDGLEDITLSEKAAMSQIWMPAIKITNREIRQYELISTSVTLTKDGQVTKVERSLIRAKNFFNLKNFPWDEQKLAVKIASTKYMASELKLKPSEDSKLSGCDKELFEDKGYILQKFETFEFEETDGGLVKSRGVMQMTVSRDTRAYEQTHLIPTFIYLTISWGVFWFPFVVQFITPRLALSILALLTFTNLCIATQKNLPVSAPFNWNDNFNQQVQALMFTTIILNIYTEIAFHQLKCEEVARAMNHECKVVVPLVSIISLSIILMNAVDKDWGMSLEATSIIVKAVYLILVVIYFFVCAKRLQEESAKHLQTVVKGVVDTHLGIAK